MKSHQQQLQTTPKTTGTSINCNNYYDRLAETFKISEQIIFPSFISQLKWKRNFKWLQQQHMGPSHQWYARAHHPINLEATKLNNNINTSTIFLQSCAPLKLEVYPISQGQRKTIDLTSLPSLSQNQGQIPWIILKPCIELLTAHNCSTTSISAPYNLLDHFTLFYNYVDPFFPLGTLIFPILRKWPNTLNKHPIQSKNLPSSLFDFLKSFNAWDKPPQHHHVLDHTLD